MKLPHTKTVARLSGKCTFTAIKLISACLILLQMTACQKKTSVSLHATRPVPGGYRYITFLADSTFITTQVCCIIDPPTLGRYLRQGDTLLLNFQTEPPPYVADTGLVREDTLYFLDAIQNWRWTIDTSAKARTVPVLRFDQKR